MLDLALFPEVSFGRAMIFLTQHQSSNNSLLDADILLNHKVRHLILFPVEEDPTINCNTDRDSSGM